MQLAPIALFAYNRPEHTRRVVASLQANALAAQSQLHVFCDGAREGDDIAAIDAVRDYVHRIEGFADVRVHEQSVNRGLARSVIAGVDELCARDGRVIVVEDDLLLSPHFLAYLNAALERYADDARVMQVSAHMFPVDIGAAEDAFFLPFTTSWGWATWASAWRCFDPAAAGYELLRRDEVRRREFDMGGAYDYSGMLRDQLDGKIDSWAIRWYLSVFLKRGIVLYPRKTLVENTGFDGSGTHTVGTSLDQLIDTDFMPTQFPAAQIDPAIRDRVFGYFRARRKPLARLRRFAERLIG